jgi:hypothetical protein
MGKSEGLRGAPLRRWRKGIQSSGRLGRWTKPSESCTSQRGMFEKGREPYEMLQTANRQSNAKRGGTGKSTFQVGRRWRKGIHSSGRWTRRRVGGRDQAINHAKFVALSSELDNSNFAWRTSQKDRRWRKGVESSGRWTSRRVVGRTQ